MTREVREEVVRHLVGCGVTFPRLLKALDRELSSFVHAYIPEPEQTRLKKLCQALDVVDVAIIIEGGAVQHVTTDHDHEPTVVIVDYDNIRLGDSAYVESVSPIRDLREEDIGHIRKAIADWNGE